MSETLAGHNPEQEQRNHEIKFWFVLRPSFRWAKTGDEPKEHPQAIPLPVRRDYRDSGEEFLAVTFISQFGLIEEDKHELAIEADDAIKSLRLFGEIGLADELDVRYEGINIKFAFRLADGVCRENHKAEKLFPAIKHFDQVGE